MKPIKKAAIFLIIIGAEKAQRILALMDNKEIKSVVSEIKSLTVLTKEMQECVLTEVKGLGYEDNMIPSQVLTIIRFLFNGSKISDKAGR
ncbi:magnesium and cobalt transport protein CorA [Dendrosporobacter sp. 1207_IL3150]|uniref:magnesium and cobalt transport protein CorA n=1 Tax=Dendrosporobacter sp. 1207_IL3150 TaxID=3084054 RepID=UPI002FDA2A91